ncbi:hypothetical protein ACFQY8_00270 [Alloscardovia venturai]|uniref:Uncharacterized protein n=2 Tax=Alloscardovia venturai TaxID=1769421 RepID=A0ABW2Y319_9BIFI
MTRSIKRFTHPLLALPTEDTWPVIPIINLILSIIPLVGALYQPGDTIGFFKYALLFFDFTSIMSIIATPLWRKNHLSKVIFFTLAILNSISTIFNFEVAIDGVIFQQQTLTYVQTLYSWKSILFLAFQLTISIVFGVFFSFPYLHHNVKYKKKYRKLNMQTRCFWLLLPIVFIAIILFHGAIGRVLLTCISPLFSATLTIMVVDSIFGLLHALANRKTINA